MDHACVAACEPEPPAQAAPPVELCRTVPRYGPNGHGPPGRVPPRSGVRDQGEGWGATGDGAPVGAGEGCSASTRVPDASNR